jgi:hypothetical protein
MRMLVALRLFFVMLGLASLIFGYIGLHHYIDGQILLRQRPLHDDSASNLVYYDVELFLLQCAPLSAGGPVPWQLQISRFSGPSVALYTLAELGAALFATRIHRARLRRARGHMVVCGSTRAAKVLAARLRAAGSRVLIVESAASDVEWIDRDVSLGDAGLPRTLADVGANRAAALYACHEHGDQNTRIAEAAAELRRTTGHPRKIQVLIPDHTLCTALRACLVQSDAQHMGYFNPDELAAQTTVRTDHTALAAAYPEIAIAGTGAFARSRCSPSRGAPAPQPCSTSSSTPPTRRPRTPPSPSAGTAPRNSPRPARPARCSNAAAAATTRTATGPAADSGTRRCTAKTSKPSSRTSAHPAASGSRHRPVRQRRNSHAST